MNNLLDELKALVPAELGAIEHYKEENGAVRMTLSLNGQLGAEARSVKRALERTVVERTGVEPFVAVKEANPKAVGAKKPLVERLEGMRGVARVVAVASGKGGVGKSSVAAALARSLAARGLKVGVLDADIYGPSMPLLFGVEGYQPVAADKEGKMILPATTAEGIKVMSIGFFVAADQALVWRGPMATSALRQMIHQTEWGALDALVVDLPPGTGDIHLSVVGEVKVDGAWVVTTPSDLALADVLRGVAMFRAEHVEVPVLGLIDNMAWFVPDDAPDKKYFVFGTHGPLDEVVRTTGIPVALHIPVGGLTPELFDTLEIK